MSEWLSEKANPEQVPKAAPEKLDIDRFIGNGNFRDNAFAVSLLTPPPTSAEHSRKSYLETAVNSLTSNLISDEEQLNTVNHYATEFIKTTALFTPGKVGVFGTVALQGLGQASPTDALGAQAGDMALGMAKGGVMRGAFSVVGKNFSFAPTKGILIGTSVRAADAFFQRDLFTDPSAVRKRLGQELLNPQALVLDAAVFGLGEGLFGLGNKATAGALARNKILGSMSMGASFGMVGGGTGEIIRQQTAGEDLDVVAVVKSSLLQGSIDALAGGLGGKVGELSLSRATNIERATNGQVKEYKLTSGREALEAFRRNESDTATVLVRALGAPGEQPIQRMLVQRMDSTEAKLSPLAKTVDLIASCHPENLSAAERAKHVFPEATGRVWLLNGAVDTIAISTEHVPMSVWRNGGYRDPLRLDFGQTTINVMSPLLVGDPANPKGVESVEAWKQFDADLKLAKQAGIDGVSTDVWWGLVQPTEKKFNWSYYDKLSEHITKAQLKWVPILSFHSCGGNVGDNVNVPIPEWIWKKAADRTVSGKIDAVKFVSEQGNASNEFVSFWATPLVLDSYAGLMRNFQTQYAKLAPQISEVNVSLGPSGELRYPSYNSHDQGTGWPTRGANQGYSELAKEAFRDYVVARYGSTEAVGKAWGIENLTREAILPPSNPSDFFGRNHHKTMQYGRDYFDCYSQSLINHGRTMLGAAVNIFGAQEAPFHGIEIAAKIPGVHWRVGSRAGDSITFGDRLAELNAGLIRTSRNDWFSDDAGRGYRPILAMFKELNPIVPGRGSRVVPVFTAVEMPDGVDGPSVQSLPNTLAKWVGMEARRQGLTIRGENALSGNLGSSNNWNIAHALLDLPNQPGYYNGITFLRMSDVVNNAVARAELAEIIYAIRALEPQRKTGTGN